MRASAVLVASSSAERGTVVLTHTASTMVVIGASVPMTVNVGASNIHSFGVCPDKDKQGVVAVSIRIDKGKRDCEWLDFMLPVLCWKEGKPFVDLDNVWIPSADRRGQAVSQHINLCIDDEWFTTSTYRGQYSKEKDMRYVPDPNLALRYLVGDATAQEVIAAAEEAKAEASAQEQLKAVQEELKLLQEQKESLERTCETLYADNEQLKRLGSN